MPDPQKHADDRNWLESLGRMIPGFRGYLEKQYRRESDQLARQWLGERLERSKQGLTDYTRSLTEAGRLAELGVCEQLRSRLDRLIGKFRAAPAGYSGLFDFVKVREDRLDQVYAHDASMMDGIDKIAVQIEGLGSSQEDASLLIPGIVQQLDESERMFNRRADLLAGLED